MKIIKCFFAAVLRERERVRVREREREMFFSSFDEFIRVKYVTKANTFVLIIIIIIIKVFIKEEEDKSEFQ